MPNTLQTSRGSDLDAHGNRMTGDPASIALYDQAIDRFVRFHPEILDIAGKFGEPDVAAPMGWALIAYLHLMSTEAGDLAAARDALAELEASAGNERERAHAAAIGRWRQGDWIGAARTLDELGQRWPTDMLALMFGHQLDFFVGDAQRLRDRTVRAVREFDPMHPHAGFVRGLSAFGLEEAGHYQHAIEAGMAAVDANADDVWAIHAVVHAYEMQGQIAAGIDFMRSDRTRWETGNLFTVHNWWHLALYELEAGRLDGVLEIYDREVHNAESACVAMEMLDASALLWRLLLDGADTGDRWAALADAWAAKTDADPWYVFNDVHAVMALVGAGRIAEARALVTARAQAAAGDSSWNAAVSGEVGLPVARSLIAFGVGAYDEVIDTLMPIRGIVQRFGGSHAQRDAVQRTILEAALRSGRFELARALTAERLGVRDTSVYSWTQRARALRGLGETTAAAAADEAARSHRAAIVSAS